MFAIGSPNMLFIVFSSTRWVKAPIFLITSFWIWELVGQSGSRIGIKWHLVGKRDLSELLRDLCWLWTVWAEGLSGSAVTVQKKTFVQSLSKKESTQLWSPKIGVQKLVSQDFPTMQSKEKYLKKNQWHSRKCVCCFKSILHLNKSPSSASTNVLWYDLCYPYAIFSCTVPIQLSSPFTFLHSKVGPPPPLTNFVSYSLCFLTAFVLWRHIPAL